MKNIACVVLAAGKGTRMKSQELKVLHRIYQKPMINYVLDVVKTLGIKRTLVVGGHRIESLKKRLQDSVELVKQEELLGTGDAVNRTRKLLINFKGDVLVLYADTPLLTQKTLEGLINTHVSAQTACTLVTTILRDPTGYGRIVRNYNDRIVKIAEEKDASVFERAIEEINVGTYCFKAEALFKALSRISPDNKKQEYYLTDTISLLSKSKGGVNSYFTPDEDEALGVNSRVDLARAHMIVRQRTSRAFMEKGVTIVDTNSTFIDPTAKIGIDTVIWPFTVIEKDVQIGRRCRLGPFCRVRSSTVVEDDVQLGNFVEINRSRIKKLTRIKHQAYLGDAWVGEEVNIGAGTITANYDGKKKNRTQIDDKAFVGSGTILVAPVKVGKAAVTGAGSVVTKGKDVPPGAVVVGMPAKPLKKTRPSLRAPKGRSNLKSS